MSLRTHFHNGMFIIYSYILLYMENVEYIYIIVFREYSDKLYIYELFKINTSHYNT